MSKTLAIANGDLEINARGSVDLIEGRDKLSQDFAEILLSDFDATRNYGAKLSNIVVATGAAKSFVASELYNVVSRLQQHQQEDPNCTASERLSAVTKLNVEVDGRDVYFEIGLQSQDRGTLTIKDGIRLRSTKLGHILPNTRS